MKTLNVSSTIEHKHQGLPRFVCIPMKTVDVLAARQSTTRTRRAARALGVAG